MNMTESSSLTSVFAKYIFKIVVTVALKHNNTFVHDTITESLVLMIVLDNKHPIFELQSMIHSLPLTQLNVIVVIFAIVCH